MPEVNESVADPITLLRKRIDEQARLTRMLVAVCCLAVLASMFYSLVSIIGIIPNLTLTRILGNIESIHTRWHSLDKLSIDKVK